MRRFLIALMCLATAGGLGYAAISDRWLENRSPESRVSFSLLSSKRCAGESATCDSKSNTELMTELALQPKENASMAFATAGQATLGLSVLSALLLFICAGYLIANKRTAGPNGPQHLALIALMLVGVAATVFIKLKPGGATGVGAGPGFWVFAASAFLGIIVSQAASKQIKPLDPEPDLTL